MFARGRTLQLFSGSIYHGIDLPRTNPNPQNFEPATWNFSGPVAVYATYNSQFVEMTMDWNRVEGNWKQTKGKIKEKWGQLTDDDLQQVNGKRDQLEGKIQERYGIAKDRARQDIDDWLKTMDRHSAM
jgi:uncharacterized protein YjbJ (UPF0337 family)